LAKETTESGSEVSLTGAIGEDQPVALEINWLAWPGGIDSPGNDLLGGHGRGNDNAGHRGKK